MKILTITGAFHPKIDGSAIAAGNLVRHLAKDGHRITVLTRGYGVSGEENWNGVPVVRIPQLGFSLASRAVLVIDQIRKGARLMKATRFDVIHAHGFASLFAAEVLALPRRVPVVVTFHGLQRLWNRDWSLMWRLRFHFLVPFEGLLARRATLVLAQSKLLMGVLSHLYRIRPDRMIVLPNSVDITTFGFHPPAHLSDTVLFVGTLGSLYGPEILVRAADIVVRAIPTARFVFVGRGPSKELATRLAKELGLENRVKFVGLVSDKMEMEAYYASSKVLVIPFRGRGGYILSLAALEALAVGRPVIMGYESDETAGVIHSPSEPAVLAERIIQVLSLDRESYSKLSGEARSSAERFDSNEIANQVEMAYLRLLGNVNK